MKIEKYFQGISQDFLKLFKMIVISSKIEQCAKTYQLCTKFSRLLSFKIYFFYSDTFSPTNVHVNQIFSHSAVYPLSTRTSSIKLLKKF